MSGWFLSPNFQPSTAVETPPMSHQFDPSSQHTEAKVEGTPSEEIHDTHGETRYFLAKPWGPGDSRIAVVEHGMFDLNELVVEPTHLKHIIQ